MDVDHLRLAGIPEWILTGREVVAWLHGAYIGSLLLPVRDRASVLSGQFRDLG
jgi:hypothetical protein